MADLRQRCAGEVSIALPLSSTSNGSMGGTRNGPQHLICHAFLRPVAILEQRWSRNGRRWTTEMAWRFWELYRDVSWTWTPTITGYSIEEFECHARELVPLIRQMLAYYSDPGWDDDGEEEEYGNPFRVGIGSLCGRASPAFILEVVTRIQAIIGIDVPLHLWGDKVRHVEAGIALPGVISCDSGAWNGLFGQRA